MGEDLLPQRDDGTADTMEERENEEEELQKGQIKIQKRVERQVKKFISRYLKGINNSQFQTLVGYEVLSKNYIIFDHILWRLFSKEWMGEDYIIDSFLNIWRLFWGTSNQDEAGYFLKLSDDQQDQVLLWHYEHHCDAQLLAALFYSAFISREEGWEARYFALRDFLHKILNHPYFTITDEELIIAHQILFNLIPFPAPTYLEIIDELIALSNYNNQSSFLRSFEKKYNLPPQSCNFKTAEVKDRSNPNNDKNKQVDVIIINAPALLTDIEAISAVTDWQRFEIKSYYRIYSIASKRGIYYEVNIQESCYWSADSKDMFDIDLGPIIPPVLTYEVALARLRKIANKLDMFLESNTAKPAS
ncbi:MAG TPA: hypothetical protein VH186_23075 [Chloroflexia bacterium]|nr:hypothetical protein [Chloroflexia bacterium]